MEFPCGALALDAPHYIERPPIESRCCDNLEIPGSLTRIKGPRHTGKSSLLVRALAHAKALNYQSVFVDFQAAEASTYSDLSRFLRWLCAAVARQLKLPPALDDYWDDEMGAKLNATFYFEDYLFAQVDGPIVLALNEVNRVFEHPEIARDFLPLLRFWFEQAKQGESFRQLRTLVVHSTDVYVPLNIHQSPFNVGLPITLTPFDLGQSQQLAERYGVTFHHDKDHQALRALVGGHPYLLSIAFYYLGQGQLSLSQLLAQSPTPGGIYRHHLQACLDAMEGQSALIEGLQRVVTAMVPVEVDPAIAYRLSRLGVVVLEGNACRPACELYRLFFAQHGLHAPSEDLQRLRAENEQLKVLANLDGLTQLANRRVFDEQIKADWERAICHSSVISLIMLDIDFFKPYNDTYGHLAGDFCLRQVAQVLRAHGQRATDTVARYGGEEFAIVLPNTELTAATEIASQLRDSVRALNIAHESSKLVSKHVTISLGVASVVPMRNQFPADLIAAADAALYVSKQQGRDRLTVSNALANCPLHQVS